MHRDRNALADKQYDYRGPQVSLQKKKKKKSVLNAYRDMVVIALYKCSSECSINVLPPVCARNYRAVSMNHFLLFFPR